MVFGQMEISIVLIAFVITLLGSMLARNTLLAPQAPMSTNSNNSNSLDLYVYPGSQQLSQEADKTTLESSDKAETVGNWYKNIINAQGASIKTFITTKANEKVLIKLVGTNKNLSISVTISQESSKSKTKIDLVVTRA